MLAVVDEDVRDTTPEDLVSEAVRSDQGSQYTATRFKDLVAHHGARQGMSRRGNGVDNAPAEPFRSHFKVELLDGDNFPSLAEVKLKISHHVAYYNITTSNGGIRPWAT